MKRKISIEEIEEIIKNKLNKQGILNVIGDDKISEIKNKIKDILDNGKKLEEQNFEKNEQEIIKSEKSRTAPTQTSNPNITLKTSEDKDKTEFLEKNKELEIKENDLIKKELELEEKEKLLKIKEMELSYKPELPELLKNINPGEVIVFDSNELSFGMENLTQRDFRIKNNPDEKKSVKDLWLLSGITKTDVYKVELKKIGELNFNPYDGTTTFQNNSNLDEYIIPEESLENNHNVEGAIESQFPKEEMVDSINPIKDVTQPIMNVDDIKKQEFENNFKDVITKIVSDELNKISSQTTKKNIFSL